MSLIDHKDRFRVVKDEIGDPRLDCRPTTAAATLFDDGPNTIDVWISETSRPVATSNAIIATLKRHGIKAERGQTGDTEIIVKIQHGGDLAVEAKILGLMRAKKRRRLSEVEKARLAEASKPFRFSKGHGATSDFSAPESKISTSAEQRDGSRLLTNFKPIGDERRSQRKSTIGVKS